VSITKRRLTMRKSTRLLISMAVLVMIIGAIFFAGKPQPSSAQNDGFKIYDLLVFCGDSQLASAIFGHEATEGGTVGRPLMGTKTICVGKCGGGTVTLPAALAGLPAAVSAALQAKVDKHQADAAAGKAWRLNCLGDGKKPPDCYDYGDAESEGAVPWFDPSARGAMIYTTRSSPQPLAAANARTRSAPAGPSFSKIRWTLQMPRAVPESIVPSIMAALPRFHKRFAATSGKRLRERAAAATRKWTPTVTGSQITSQGPCGSKIRMPLRIPGIKSLTRLTLTHCRPG